MIRPILKNVSITLPIPLFGVGCGVLGLSLAKVKIELGKYASTLLRALEYRGYDSTGAAFQGDSEEITLLKDVGAPSTLVKTLGMEDQGGQLFCGQVRWATFGTVNKDNAQPHEVYCKRHIYGAHNGNITNTPELKRFLLSEGHRIVSDNDGEMLVHTVEHYFDNELDKLPPADQLKRENRMKCMRLAILQAYQKMVGSYAAVVVDPQTKVMYAIKAGSSLYFGVGEVAGTPFGLASSDLSAVLKFTKQLVNLREGEFIEYTDSSYQVFAFKDLKVKRPNLPDLHFAPGQKIQKDPVQSKLRAEDTELIPPFQYFMEQEIHAEVESTGKLLKLIKGGSNTGRRMRHLLQSESMMDDISDLCTAIASKCSFAKQKKLFVEYADSDKGNNFYQLVKENYRIIYQELVKENFEKKYFFSNEKNTYIELLNSTFDKKRLLLAKALDSISEKHDVEEFTASVDNFLEILKNVSLNNGTIYTIACGTSFHATKVASLFFNEIAHLNIIPTLPGDFRGQFSKSLKDNDVIIGVSQSGETKDLIDIFNDVERSGLDIKLIVLVNNMNSTLGQEKSDVSIPIVCGPEIAVPATKSFMNQIALFYYLAIRVASVHLEIVQKAKMTDEEYHAVEEKIKLRMLTIDRIPSLIKETIESTQDQIEEVAAKIYMEPSMHILATKITGVAKEGALKIRETVLNHTEGGEASEFKHGPNTILGKNTVFGVKNTKALLRYFNESIDQVYLRSENQNIPFEERRKIAREVSNFTFTRSEPFNLGPRGMKIFKDITKEYNYFEKMYRNYPLIYITGPDDRDVNLTISQINTHKIRGADTFVIAEEDDKLMDNARTNPHDKGYYGWGYIMLPKTGDSLLTAFSSTVVLQLLALRMSIRKMKYLDRLELKDHGVHPDVPKNVSKSITVD